LKLIEGEIDIGFLNIDNFSLEIFLINTYEKIDLKIEVYLNQKG
jgi:hypothetical protein